MRIYLKNQSNKFVALNCMLVKPNEAELKDFSDIDIDEFIQLKQFLELREDCILELVYQN